MTKDVVEDVKGAVALICEGGEGGRADPQKPPLTSFSSVCVVLEEVSELSNRRPAARRREVRALQLEFMRGAENPYYSLVLIDYEVI
jgi:hypothetical protein